MKFSASGSQEDEVLTLWSHQTPLSGCPTPPAKLDIFTPIRGQRNPEREISEFEEISRTKFQEPEIVLANFYEPFGRETGCE
jgi:hypothetical protein